MASTRRTSTATSTPSTSSRCCRAASSRRSSPAWRTSASVAEPPLLHLAPARFVVVEFDGELEVVTVGIVEVDGHPAQPVRLQAVIDPLALQVFDPAVVVLERDDVGMMLAAAAGRGHPVLAGWEEIDGGVSKLHALRSRAHTLRLAGAEDLTIEALGALHVRGDKRPVLDVLDRRRSCHRLTPGEDGAHILAPA